MPRRKHRDLTDIEREYLASLGTEEMKGKDLRERLRERGAYEHRMKFYRVMQWLKMLGFVESERIARDKNEYRGAQCIYRLTEAGMLEIEPAVETHAVARSGSECREQIGQEQLVGALWLRLTALESTATPYVHGGSRTPRFARPAPRRGVWF